MGMHEGILVFLVSLRGSSGRRRLLVGALQVQPLAVARIQILIDSLHLSVAGLACILAT